MALPQITFDDFKGFYKLTLNQFKEEDLAEYIPEFIESYIRYIVGDGAFTDIKNQDFQKWNDLVNGVDFVNEDKERVTLVGLKKLLVGFIFFEYVRDNFTTTVTGRVKGKSENSERATDIEVANIARSRFNRLVTPFNMSMKNFLEVNEALISLIGESVDLLDNRYLLTLDNPVYLNTGQKIEVGVDEYTVIEIQLFAIDAGATGLDFTGDQVIWTFQQTVESSEDNGDNTYNILVSSTEALNSGDTVNIDGTDYIASNVIVNTCFTIDAGATGLDFTGQTAEWEFSTEVVLSIDNGDNTYLLSVADSIYVAEGVTVSIDLTDYVIGSLSSKYLITADSTGLDFIGDKAIWNPFDAVRFEEIEISGI